MGIEGLDDDKTATIRHSNYTINFDGFDGCTTNTETESKDLDEHAEFKFYLLE